MSGKWKVAYSAEEVEWVDCPLCKSSSYSKLVQEWSLGIVQCSLCHLIYVNPRVKDPEMNYWGEKEATLRKYCQIFDGLQPHDRDSNYLEHLKTLRAAKPIGKLLDVGTHCGFFLRMARNQGWELHGIEPCPTNAALARERFGLDVRVGYLEDGSFPLEYFDIVTMIDVLEHVTTPLKLLNTVRKLLKPDGILFLKVPNAHWNLLKYRLLVKSAKLKGFDIFDSREHVVHYSQETLAKILDRAGFLNKRFYVPWPIQSGQWWRRAGRSAAWTGARIAFLYTGKLGRFATDLACVAKKG